MEATLATQNKKTKAGQRLGLAWKTPVLQPTAALRS